MPTDAPTPATRLPMAVLAIAIVLALIGAGGLVTGAADNTSDDDHDVAAVTTTTSSSGESSDTSSAVTVTLPPTTSAATTRKPTATTKVTTATTQPTAPVCAFATASGNPGAAKPPAVGTYTYASCTSDDKVNVVVTAGNSGGGITRRNIETQSQLGNITANDAFGPNGVIQETAKIVAFGFTLNCDWMPDIVEYPAALAVGTAWAGDSECNLGNGAKMHATGNRKITGVASFTVGGTAVTAWTIDETQKIVITAPNRSPSNFNSTSTYLYDASRGVIIYQKAVSEASGSVSQPKTTTEIRLTSLTPKT